MISSSATTTNPSVRIMIWPSSPAASTSGRSLIGRPVRVDRRHPLGADRHLQRDDVAHEPGHERQRHDARRSRAATSLPGARHGVAEQVSVSAVRGVVVEPLVPQRDPDRGDRALARPRRRRRRRRTCAPPRGPRPRRRTSRPRGGRAPAPGRRAAPAGRGREPEELDDRAAVVAVSRPASATTGSRLLDQRVPADGERCPPARPARRSGSGASTSTSTTSSPSSVVVARR